MDNNFYQSENNVDREEVLKNGDIFDVYKCPRFQRKQDRRKMIISTRSEGFFSIHICKYCRMKVLDQNDLHVFHLKKTMPPSKNNCSEENNHLTKPLKQSLHQLNRNQ